MLKSFVAALVLAISLTALAVGAPVPKSKGKEKGHATPQAAFAAVQAAVNKGDIKAVFNSVTPELGELIAAQLAWDAQNLRAKASSNKQLAEKVKPVLDVLNRHGIGDAFAKQLEKELLASLEKRGTFEDFFRILRKLVGPVKDKAAFVSEMTAALTAVPNDVRNREELLLELFSKSKLKDLKVIGDKGTSSIVLVEDGKEQPWLVKTIARFTKVKGGWLVDLPKFEQK